MSGFIIECCICMTMVNSKCCSNEKRMAEAKNSQENGLSLFQSEELEQEIIELLLNALKLCDTETPGPRQILYVVRSGLIHRRLGQIYFNAMKTDGSLNDTRKKKLLQLSRLYYEKAAKTFEAIDAHSEFLNVLSDRLLLQDYLCEGLLSRIPKFSTRNFNINFPFSNSKRNPKMATSTNRSEFAPKFHRVPRQHRQIG